MIRTVYREIWVPYPIEDVFDFFGRAENLETITPSTLSFRILTPGPIEVRKGTLIDYRIKLGLFPMRWRTLISAWDPPNRFVDEQLIGPYRQWVHEHTFDAKDGGTLIRDRVTYEVPGWLLGPFIYRLFVRPQLERIFDYRTEAITQILRSAWRP